MLPNHLQRHAKVTLAGNAAAQGLTLPGKLNLPGQVACCLKPELHLGASPISRFLCVFKSSRAKRYVAAKVEYYLDFGINIKCALVISSEIGYDQDVHPRQHAPLQYALTR